MDLSARFTLLFSVAALAFLAIFSFVVYQQVRTKSLYHAQQSLIDLLEHEWEHIDLPDHQARAKPGVPHFKDVYLRIQKSGTTLYDSFQAGIEAQPPGIDLKNKRIFHSIKREHNGHEYEILGYHDLISTLDYLRFLKNVLIAGCVVSLFLLIPLGYSGTKFLLKPFRILAEETSKISADELSFRFNSQKKLDEVGLLSKNFNSLLQRLEKSFHLVRRFASNASHELRTPLAVIIGQIEVSLRRQRTIPEYQQVLSKSLAQARDLSGTVNRLLFLSDVEHIADYDMERVGLKRFMEDVLVTIREGYPGKKEVELSTSDPELYLVTNRQMLHSIVSNLLANGVKYSSSRIRVSWEKKSQEIKFRFDDDGPGIPKEQREIVFEPFVKLSRKNPLEKSHGLGLSIAKACVEALKGKIRIESSTMGGASIRVTLPA